MKNMKEKNRYFFMDDIETELMELLLIGTVSQFLNQLRKGRALP